MSAIILDVKNISFGYQPRTIIENAHFHLHEGDFCAVIGANGAGKSTLLKIILGELAPRQGTVLLYGKDARAFNDRTRMAFLPQNAAQSAFSFPVTAFEVVSAVLFARHIGFSGIKRRKQINGMAHNALSLTGMQDKARCLMQNLSGGERQRILLARALALRPDFLILDEPTTGIDSKSVENFFELLSKLNKEESLSIIMVTHDIVRAASFVNRIFCIEDGNIQEITHEQIKKEINAKHIHTNEDPHGDCRDVSL